MLLHLKGRKLLGEATPEGALGSALKAGAGDTAGAKRAETEAERDSGRARSAWRRLNLHLVFLVLSLPHGGDGGGGCRTSERGKSSTHDPLSRVPAEVLKYFRVPPRKWALSMSGTVVPGGKRARPRSQPVPEPIGLLFGQS